MAEDPIRRAVPRSARAPRTRPLPPPPESPRSDRDGFPEGSAGDAPRCGNAPPAGGKRFGRLLRLTGSAAVGGAVGWFLLAQVGQVFRIEGESMAPALRSGERVVVDKLGFRFGRIERGDVLVFRPPSGGPTAVVKRVVALPGETVRFRGDEITVLGSGTPRASGSPVPDTTQRAPGADSVFVADGHYFVVGDNRAKSSDSRRFGLLARDSVIGEAVFRVFPPGRIAAPSR